MTAKRSQSNFATVEIDRFCQPGNYGGMQNRLKEWRERRGLTLQKVADHLGTSAAQVHKLESGKLRLKAETLTALAELYKTQPGDLLISKGNTAVTKQRTKDKNTGLTNEKGGYPQLYFDFDKVIEIDARAAAGQGGDAVLEVFSPDNENVILREVIQGEWGFPVGYLTKEVRIAPGSGRIVEVIGDSMEKTLYSGDRLMVNVADRTPSPPGIFVLWDGLGVIVKRIEYIPGTTPARLRIISDNPAHEPYERTVDEIHIIGRAQWYARRL